MGFRNIGALHAAWTARYEHDKPLADSNDIAFGRAAAYAVGVEVLSQHLDGLGAGQRNDLDLFAPMVARHLAPEFVGKSMPVQALPHLFGMFIGVGVNAMQVGKESSVAINAMSTAGMHMAIELIAAVGMMAEDGAL